MKKILLLTGVLLVISFLAYLFIFSSAPEGEEHTPTYTLLGLPESPLDATYFIEGSEVLFSGGHAEMRNEESGEKMTLVSTREPIFGDVNGDEKDDAVLLLLAQAKGVEDTYYVALALNDDGGFLGINSVRLENRTLPQEVSIQDEILVITYPESEEGGTESHVYMTLMNVTLQTFIPVKETDRVYKGEVAYEGDMPVFTSCETGTKYSVSPDSKSLVALKAVYTQRVSLEGARVPLYIVLSGTFETPSSDEEEVSEVREMLDISTILSVPKAGTCPVSTIPETEAEPETDSETVISEEFSDVETVVPEESEEILGD